MFKPELKEVILGSAEVRQVFKLSKGLTVAGCMVSTGKITRSEKIRVVRGDTTVWTGRVGALKRFKAPKRPTALSMPMDFHSPMLELREERRDPTGYYWFNKPEGGGVGALTCDEFRPTQRQIDCFYVRGQESLKRTINIEVGATNLGKPVRLEARVEAALTETTWLESAVLRRLPTWIARELADAS